MAKTKIAMRVRPYDHVCPLLLGLVEAPGLELSFDMTGPLEMDFPQTLQAAEVSFTRYMTSYALGQDELIGLPAFILRGYRHRNFFVMRDSPLRSLSQLKGKRVATNSWGDTGTLWARAAMRDAGVEMADVTWVTGQLDPATPAHRVAPFEAPLPERSETLKAGDTLMAALAEGRVDAVTTAFAPADVFTNGGKVRRLVENYVEVERDYHARTGIYPNFHLIALRRGYAEAHPDVAVALYQGLQRSWDHWWTKAKKFSETGPWAMAEHETMAKEFPDDTPPFGLASAAHRKMLKVMCAEQKAQGLVARAADSEALFADFGKAAKAVGFSDDGL